MRILAAHDAQGNIQHMVLCPADSPLAMVTAETGLLVSAVAVPDALAKVDLTDEEGSRRQLAEVYKHLQTFRVEVGVESKLTRKT